MDADRNLVNQTTRVDIFLDEENNLCEQEAGENSEYNKKLKEYVSMMKSDANIRVTQNKARSLIKLQVLTERVYKKKGMDKILDLNDYLAAKEQIIANNKVTHEKNVD